MSCSSQLLSVLENEVHHNNADDIHEDEPCIKSQQKIPEHDDFSRCKCETFELNTLNK